MRFLHERDGREALQDGGAGVGGADGGRDLDGLGGRAGGVLGVAAGGHPDDAVAGGEGVVVSGAGGEDGAGGFAAEDLGFGGRVEAGAVVAGWEEVSRIMRKRRSRVGRGGVTCQCN